MQIPNTNRYLLSIYVESAQSIQTFQLAAGLEFRCKFLVL